VEFDQRIEDQHVDFARQHFVAELRHRGVIDDRAF